MNIATKIVMTVFKMIIGAVIGGVLTGLAFMATIIWALGDTGPAFVGGAIIGGVIGAICGAFWNKNTKDKIVNGAIHILSHFG